MDSISTNSLAVGHRSFAATALLTTLTLLAASAPAATARSRSYTFAPGAYRAQARYAVTYTGSGTYSTVDHSVPPNPGGKHDSNDVHDSSTQAWSLRFVDDVAIGPCTPSPPGTCAQSPALRGASGHAVVAGQIHHRHHDGLFAYYNVTIACHVRAQSHLEPGAMILFNYAAGGSSVSITAQNPIGQAIGRLPQACPGRGDPIDGLPDNYYTPGFSPAPGFGPDPWFTSGPVTVPLDVLHRARIVRIALVGAKPGRPSSNCATHPAFDRCTARGSWSGELTLRAVP